MERGKHSSLQEHPFQVNEHTRQPWAGAHAAPAREPSGNGPHWNQALSISQGERGQVQQQPHTLQHFQPWVQQPQRQVRDQPGAQPVVHERSQTAEQAQQQAEPSSHVPIPESVVVTRTPPATASSVLEDQDHATDSATAPPPPFLEPDPYARASRLQLREAYAPTPSVVGHARRPFGIPELARDMFAGRPNHYDETAARWAARWAQLGLTWQTSPDDDYDDGDSDGTVSDIGGGINRGKARGKGKGKGKGKEPAHAGLSPDTLPGRGRKRNFSKASSAVDSTLSAELDEPSTPATPAAAVVPGTEALRRNLRDDATVACVRRDHGERAALDMTAAANTLQGAGRGLGGVADAQVVANDLEIRRRQEAVDTQGSRRRRRGASSEGEEDAPAAQRQRMGQ
ncbi:hypothetical protein KVR01_005514 [Diaporthe batatas]|uniref:uncharacterized protein n=1 Tax=Diaporthe batatas TaxID=748121 RepID=UPI001D04A64F|nr:uncharacterized protein KVR01_005514 [Diaporthe batatas]KAG8165239.1 hypothetical protein KVR01_005514 [Diaporthe batatas]